jgi:hypothetical protein
VSRRRAVSTFFTPGPNPLHISTLTWIRFPDRPILPLAMSPVYTCSWSCSCLYRFDRVSLRFLSFVVAR